MPRITIIISLCFMSVIIVIMMLIRKTLRKHRSVANKVTENNQIFQEGMFALLSGSRAAANWTRSGMWETCMTRWRSKARLDIPGANAHFSPHLTFPEQEIRRMQDACTLHLSLINISSPWHRRNWQRRDAPAGPTVSQCQPSGCWCSVFCKPQIMKKSNPSANSSLRRAAIATVARASEINTTCPASRASPS